MPTSATRPLQSFRHLWIALPILLAPSCSPSAPPSVVPGLAVQMDQTPGPDTVVYARSITRAGRDSASGTRVVVRQVVEGPGGTRLLEVEQRFPLVVERSWIPRSPNCAPCAPWHIARISRSGRCGSPSSGTAPWGRSQPRPETPHLEWRRSARDSAARSSTPTCWIW